MQPAEFCEPTEVLERPETEERWVRWVLALTLLLCFALRAWNGSFALDSTRFFDERFSLRNVATLLVEGQSRPANAFYGSLSYLPQTLALYVSEQLHQLTGIESLAIFDETASDGWSRTAYLITRLVCAVFGTLSVWLTFLVGRRLFSARVGLLGAILLTAFPRHILASTEFKPDILVVVFVLLTFLWSLDAARHPTPRRMLLAGAGVGLAVATKYTGVGVAIPLTVGVLLYRWRDLRIWKTLIGAGLASILTFVVLNIHIAVILEYLPRIWRIMETKGDATGGSHWTVVWLEIEFLINHHGRLLFALALVGIAGLARRLWDSTTSRGKKVEAAMVLSYIFGYSALYAAATKLFKGQNYLPVGAFTSILAAWIALALWDRLVERLPVLRHGALAGLLWIAMLVPVFEPPVSIIYRDVVPTTLELVQKEIRRMDPLELRHAYYEREGEAAEYDGDYYGKRREVLRATRAGHWFVALPHRTLQEVAERDLDLADAELFFSAGLEDPESQQFYLRRATRPGTRSLRFEPRPFHSSGPAVVLALHPWQAVGEPELLELTALGENRFLADPTADPEPTDAYSLSLWLPLATGRHKARQVEIGDQELTLHRTRRGGKRAHYSTRRFVLPAERESLEIRFDPKLRFVPEPEIRLCRWQKPI